MRITLSPTDSTRWLSGDPEAWLVEEGILEWAESQRPILTEPVVVALADGRTAFAFTVDRGDL
jgi:hypothetical protein